MIGGNDVGKVAVVLEARKHPLPRPLPQKSGRGNREEVHRAAAVALGIGWDDAGMGAEDVLEADRAPSPTKGGGHGGPPHCMGEGIEKLMATLSVTFDRGFAPDLDPATPGIFVDSDQMFPSAAGYRPLRQLRLESTGGYLPTFPCYGAFFEQDAVDAGRAIFLASASRM